MIYPGKDNGIVWLAEKTPDRPTVGQRLQSGDNPDPQTIDGANGGNVVSRNHLWTQTSDALQRRPLNDLDKDGNLNFVQLGKRRGTSDEVAVLTCTVEQQKCYLSTGILQQNQLDRTSVLDVVQH